MIHCAARPLLRERKGMLDPGAQAHCKRVAAWCEELSLVLDISGGDASALQEAALMHHHPLAFLQGSSRLAGELGFAMEEEAAIPRVLSLDAEKILSAFLARRPVAAGRRVNELVRILDMANAFDEQLEFSPFESEQLSAVLQRCLERHEDGNRSAQFVLRYLRKARLGDLAAVIPRLPVYPAVAMKLYTLLSDEEVSLASLDRVAKSDQVIAGKILQAANSVFYSPRQAIKTVSQAISYVGIEDARRLLLASALQPLYASPRLKRIWKHAVEAAQVAEQMAAMSRNVQPAEAFLIGLLHDVGKLAIALMPAELNSSLDRLIVKGCESAVAEVVVCGFDHAEAGAEILSHWRFTDDVTSAVRHHHAPERSSSPMASILYLVEYWTDSEEDIPSNSRLDAAFQVAGISPEDLRSAKFHLNEALSGL
jgi:putative nucleotidyltransferase with HDIG domain